MNRRNVLVGLGTIVVGGGAALGSGAFSTVEASRTVSVGVAEDSQALIGLEQGDNESNYLNWDDGYLTIDLDSETLGAGINVEAELTIDDALTITNNAGEEVNLSIDLDDDGSGIALEFDGTNAGSYDETLGGGASIDDIDIVVDTEGVEVDGEEDFDLELTFTATPTS